MFGPEKMSIERLRKALSVSGLRNQHLPWRWSAGRRLGLCKNSAGNCRLVHYEECRALSGWGGEGGIIGLCVPTFQVQRGLGGCQGGLGGSHGADPLADATFTVRAREFCLC